MEKQSQKVQNTGERTDKIQNVRVTPASRELLAEILGKVNNKQQGRSVKATEIIALALSLITPKEIRELQETSLSNADRLELKYRKYSQENAYISKDEYIGRLMKGEVPLEKE